MSHCVDIRVVYLGVTAVIECQTLFDKLLPSHNAPSASDFSVAPTADAVVVTQNVFLLLSDFLGKLIKKCGDERSILSEMIAQVGTWLCNSNSVFYDPAIHSVYCLFLNNVFNEMVSKFEEQHIPVIYADQSRIIVNNGDFPLASAINAVNQNQLTNRVDFLEISSFDKLVWIDNYNYHCIANGEISYEWNIANFIGVSFREQLQRYFTKFLEAENIYRFIREKGMDMMFEITNIYKSKQGVEEIFQNPLRSPHDITKSDVLVLLNTIFAAMENLNDENAGCECPESGENVLRKIILGTKRNVLMLLGVSDHDPRAKFVDPSLHLYILSVLCKHCLHTTNIDILRDQNCLQGNFLCPICKAVYDTEVIERWLFEESCRKIEQFQMQDLACPKGHVAHRKMPMSCKDDGGNLGNTVNKDEINEYLHTVEVAANEVGLGSLRDTISYILNFTK
ncbi:hypothetical protein TVAG_197030 [Trichomonas vaginalis G3]|uniref:DNA polymerase epsilon catalytic subunit n=1 Tax=Trichomonas vaginalis (strain ATCC PRA-98 / G3) TaxID=412133 RepID=A2EPH3_TRIV3|nr:DNA replication proofreading [Trichomonas vaginalis G3]EAY05402.1 hypothetical protein TVAG_197030 [Trichomonas vaginalis G3]KAI5523842.1 DNA replication proofreading [Trichomonas vaginalis G3]|eukprot:XP_001317625.1 hypothetical protein [Trichomonas vaginalis G3]